MLAAELYALGFRGESGGLHTTFGKILGQSFEPAALVQGLDGDGPASYEMMRGYFKPYSACRYTHAAVDAALALRAEGLDPQTVRRVEVETYDIAATLADATPQTPLAARFSTPYVVAVTLLRGDAGPRSFRPDILGHRGVLDLARRVTVREDPSFTAMTPARRPARVRLYLDDGSQREATVKSSKGDLDRPMSGDELKDKFLDLVQPVTGPDAATAAWTQLGRLETLPDLDEVTALLAPDTG
jgi:2-methylcitrate dehydratase PrpD